MTDLVRYPDWSSKLLKYMTEATSKTFEWGSFDCALNVADSTFVITGTDFAAQFRGQYNTEEGAYELLRSLGYKNTFEFAADLYPKTDAILTGFSGDLAAFDYNGETIVGLIYQSRIFSPSPGKRGMGSVTLGKAHTVFKVGEA